MFQAWWSGVKEKFSYGLKGYDAADPQKKRRNSGTIVKSSDDLLGDQDRRSVTESQRDLWRNYSVAAWAIRRHLDYVSSFNFQPMTGNPDLDESLGRLMRWYSMPQNCDAAGRHSLSQLIRIAETRAVIDGDMFFLKLSDMTLQGIEGDRIRNQARSVEPVENSSFKAIHGVEVDQYGRARAYHLWGRNEHGQYIPEKRVPARNMLHLGYFDSFDQIRGVSPLVSATTAFHDVLEVKEYARLKAKVTQLFALAIYRDSPDYDRGDLPEYQVDFGKGPVKLDLEPGDKADFLESRHPSTEFQAFITLSLQAALKALDIPWSFYDEAYTNFFGSRAALIQYQQSCRHKRDRLKHLLDQITYWVISNWIVNGVLELPSGMELSDITWEWIPNGVPWWNPEQEINGDILAIKAGLRTRTEIRRERYGDDWKGVIRRLAEEETFLKENGLLMPETGSLEIPQENTGNEPISDSE
jgi:lambda family phage portal protein